MDELTLLFGVAAAPCPTSRQLWLKVPSLEVQQARFSLARQRVSIILLEAAQERRPITILEAEQMVW